MMCQVHEGQRRNEENDLGKTLTTDLKSQLRMMNENMCAHHRETVTLHKVVSQLDTSVRTLTAIIEVSMNGITSAFNMFTSTI